MPKKIQLWDGEKNVYVHTARSYRGFSFAYSPKRLLTFCFFIEKVIMENITFFL